MQVATSSPNEPTTSTQSHVRSEPLNNDGKSDRPNTPSVNRPSTPKMNRPATPNYGSRESSREDVTVEQWNEHKIDQRALEQRANTQRGSTREDVRGVAGGGNADMMGHAIARTLAEKVAAAATPSTTIKVGTVASTLPPRAHTPTKAARLAAALLDANAAAKTPSYRGRSVSPKSRKGRGSKQGRLEGQRAQPRERGGASSPSFSTGASSNPITNANTSTVATAPAETRTRSYSSTAGRVAEAKISPGAVAATRAAAATQEASNVMKEGSMAQLLAGEGQGAGAGPPPAQKRPQSPGQSASKTSMSPAMADRLAAWRQGIVTVPSSSSKATRRASSVAAGTETAIDITNSGDGEDEVLANPTLPLRIVARQTPSATTTPAGASSTVAPASTTAATPTNGTSLKNPVQEARASRQRAKESIVEVQEQRRRPSPAAAQRQPSPQSHSKRAMSPVMAARLAAWRMNKGSGEADTPRSSSAPGLMAANANAIFSSDVNANVNSNTKATNLSAAPAWTSMRAVSPSTGRRESPRRTQYAHAHPHSPGRVITRQSSLTSMAAAAAAAQHGPASPTPGIPLTSAPSPRPNSPSYAAARGDAGPHGGDSTNSRATDRLSGPGVVRLASPLAIGSNSRHSNHKRSMSPSMVERLAEWRQNGPGGASGRGSSPTVGASTTRTNDQTPDKLNSDAPLERPESPNLMLRLEPPATPPPIPSPASPVPSTTSSASTSPPPPPPPPFPHPRQRPPSPLSPPEPAQTLTLTTADDSTITPRLHQSQPRQSDRRAVPPERGRVVGLRSGGRTVGRSSSAGANSGRPLSPIIAARMSAFQKNSGSGGGSGGGGGGNSCGETNSKVAVAGGTGGSGGVPPSWGLFINSRKGQGQGQGQGQGANRTRTNSPLADRVAKWRSDDEEQRRDGGESGGPKGTGSDNVVVEEAKLTDGQGGGQRHEKRKQSPVSNRLKEWEGRVVSSPTSPLSPAIGSAAGSALPSGFRRSVPGMGVGSVPGSKRSSSSSNNSSNSSNSSNINSSSNIGRGSKEHTIGRDGKGPTNVTAASKDVNRRDETFENDIMDQTSDKPAGDTGLSLDTRIPDPAKSSILGHAALAESVIQEGARNTLDDEREYAVTLDNSDDVECPDPAGLSPQEQVNQFLTPLESPTPSLTIVSQH